MASDGPRMDVQSHSLQRIYPTNKSCCTGALPMSRSHVMACSIRRLYRFCTSDCDGRVFITL